MAGKHKTRLIGWHPSDPAAVAWLDAEITRRGGGRGAQSAILDEALKAAMTMTTRLTEADREAVLAALTLTSAPAEFIKSRTGESDVAMAYATELAQAKHLLAQLTLIIRRLELPLGDRGPR